MNRRVVIAVVVGALLSSALAVENDEETRARKAALDVAGAFSNEGFKMRDGHWSGTIPPGERALIAVNLYAGNQYWFSAGGEDKAKRLGLEVFDETGAKVPTDVYNDEGKTAAGFSPASSGQYFIAVSVAEGGPAACCLVYSYK